MSAPNVLVACVPLTEFKGQLPAGFHLDRCRRCHAEIVVSPLTLAKMAGVAATYCCDACVVTYGKAQQQAGNSVLLRRLPGTLEPDAPMQRLIDAGLMNESPDPFFRELPEVTEEELKGPS